MGVFPITLPLALSHAKPYSKFDTRGFSWLAECGLLVYMEKVRNTFILFALEKKERKREGKTEEKRERNAFFGNYS